MDGSTASTPGEYLGTFLIQASGACQVVEVPFSFTIDEDIPAIVAEDFNWSGTFDGDTTCAIASASSYTSFNDPSGYSGYWSGNLGYGIDFELTAAPQQSTLKSSTSMESCGMAQSTLMSNTLSRHQVTTKEASSFKRRVSVKPWRCHSALRLQMKKSQMPSQTMPIGPALSMETPHAPHTFLIKLPTSSTLRLRRL